MRLLGGRVTAQRADPAKVLLESRQTLAGAEAQRPPDQRAIDAVARGLAPPRSTLRAASTDYRHGLQRQVAGRDAGRLVALVGFDRALGDAPLVDLVGAVGEAR